jgi:hypothetical protein
LLIVGITPGARSSKSSMYSSFLLARLFCFIPALLRSNNDPTLLSLWKPPFMWIELPPKFSMFCRTTRSNSFWTDPLSVSPSIYNDFTVKIHHTFRVKWHFHKSFNQFGSSKIQLTIVKRPSESIVFNIGRVSSRKSSKRRRNDETESSSRPRPSWSFEQSRRMMGGFWSY